MKVAKEGVKKLGHYLGNHIPVPKGALTAREEIAAILFAAGQEPWKETTDGFMEVNKTG